MNTDVKSKEKTEPKGIRLEKTIIDEIEQVMIEDDRSSFNNAAKKLLKDGLKVRKSKQKEASESQWASITKNVNIPKAKNALADAMVKNMG